MNVKCAFPPFLTSIPSFLIIAPNRIDAVGEVIVISALPPAVSEPVIFVLMSAFWPRSAVRRPALSERASTIAIGTAFDSRLISQLASSGLKIAELSRRFVIFPLVVMLPFEPLTVVSAVNFQLALPLEAPVSMVILPVRFLTSTGVFASGLFCVELFLESG